MGESSLNILVRLCRQAVFASGRKPGTGFVGGRKFVSKEDRAAAAFALLHQQVQQDRNEERESDGDTLPESPHDSNKPQ